MSLPELPRLTTSGMQIGNAENRAQIQAIFDDLKSAWVYLRKIKLAFPNATGEVIKQGSGGAIDITDVPTGVTYTPSVETLSGNGTVVGSVVVTFVLPTNAVAVRIQYRKQGTTQFSSVQGSSSPVRVTNLNPNTNYQFQVAGLNALGQLGPFTALELVTIPAGTPNTAPKDARYWVGSATSSLSNEVIPSGEASVVTVDPDDAIIGIAALGITTAKIADANVTTGKIANLAVTTPKRQDSNVATQAITLTGTNAAVEVLTQSFTVTHNQNKIMQVTPWLESIANEVGTARFISATVLNMTVNAFTVRVEGIFIASTVNITATCKAAYW